MESENFFLTFIDDICCTPEERVEVEKALRTARATSTDRAAFQMLNMELLKVTSPEWYGRVKKILIDDLHATIFKRVRLRTTLGLLILMGSRWAPELPLREAVSQLVEASMRRHADTPIYQVFARAVDYEWSEMVRMGPKLIEFAGDVDLSMSVRTLAPTHATLCVSGPDTALFAGYVLPGFLRGMMEILNVEGTISVVEAYDEDMVFDVKWR